MATSLEGASDANAGLWCGLRAGEVVRLRAGDIDSEQMIIRDRAVEGPQGPARDAAGGSLSCASASQNGGRRGPNASNNGVAPEHHWLFPGRSQHQPMDYASVRSTCSRRPPKAAALRKTVSLHSLRHSLRPICFERGEDIRVIQALLGHSKPERPTAR